MGVQNWSDNIILVNLAQEPQLGEEIQATSAMAADKGDCDVVVDFADVDIITSSSIEGSSSNSISRFLFSKNSISFSILLYPRKENRTR